MKPSPTPPPTDLPTLKANTERAITNLLERNISSPVFTNDIRAYLDALERESAECNSIRAINERQLLINASLVEQRDALVNERDELQQRIAELERENQTAERIAQLSAHRACGNQEQDVPNGKLAGCCVVCQVPWPCDIAKPKPVVALERGCQEPNQLADLKKWCEINANKAAETIAYAYNLDSTAQCFLEEVIQSTITKSQPTPAFSNYQCEIEGGSSRMCERGTKGCNVRHSLTFSDALRIARGLIKPWGNQPGIQTVINALEAAEKEKKI